MQDPSAPVFVEKRAESMWSVARFVLVTEFCERMAYYGIQGNLVLFFTSRLCSSRDPGQAPPPYARRPAHSTPTADTWGLVFAGTCYFTPLLGGYLADAKWTRYKTILVFCLIYLVGLIVLAVTAIRSLANDGSALAALFLVALGTGGIKPNVSTFGAEQMRGGSAEAVQTFFNWVRRSCSAPSRARVFTPRAPPSAPAPATQFYWAINLGSLIAFTVLVYVQQNVDLALGYFIPAVAMAMATWSFVSGRHRYTVVQPQGA